MRFDDADVRYLGPGVVHARRGDVWVTYTWRDGRTYVCDANGEHPRLATFRITMTDAEREILQRIASLPATNPIANAFETLLAICSIHPNNSASNDVFVEFSDTGTKAPVVFCTDVLIGVDVPKQGTLYLVRKYGTVYIDKSIFGQFKTKRRCKLVTSDATKDVLVRAKKLGGFYSDAVNALLIA